jgi:hypothetical protein
VLDTTTNFEGDQGKQQEVSEHEGLLPLALGLALELAWLSCLLFLVVLSGVVTDHEMNVVSLPATREVMGGFHQLGEEPGQDDWEKQNGTVGHDVMCLV